MGFGSLARLTGAAQGRAPCAWLAACVLAAAPVAQAQDAWPGVEAVARQLSDPETRIPTLYRLAATARLLQHPGQADPASSLSADADWLRRLADRFGSAHPHSPVLDPAAWLIHLEVSQQALQDKPLVSPSGPALEVYLDQVFDRTEARLAAVLLPELLWHLEPRASQIWQRFLDQMDADEALESALAANPPGWLAEWVNAATPPDQSEPLFEDLVRSLDAQAEAAVAAGPPDRMEWSQLRYRVLVALPGLEGQERVDAVAIMRLSDLLDGLHERRYVAFVEGLLATVAGLLEQTALEPAEASRAGRWLASALPRLSAAYARGFALVDPRLNSAVAAAYDVVTNITRPPSAGPDRIALQRELSDATAQLALLVPDLGYYFNLPVRDTIAGGMDACIGQMARNETDGSPAMTRELFNDCQQSLVELADTEARASALAGDFNGPFGDDHLARELRVTSGQRINYGIGYLHDRYATGCARPARPLPNPLEWSALATLLAWFAEQSPIYFQTPENEARLRRMRGIGQELLRVVAEQVDCFAGAGAMVSDPVSRTLVDYRSALVAVGAGISTAVSNYRNSVLKPGADLVLQRDATQATAYRPDDLMIGPCNPNNTCEMSSRLPSTRALLGLFPNEYLIADQSRRGEVEICYDDMSWVRRRSEPVRADDANVANYYGHLSFKLLGRYRSGQGAADVFGFQFTSPDEHHYLFGARSDEVLEDECPVERIGKKIVTSLKHQRGIVPNRLTYMAAPRMLPSRLLATHWERGAEWRDWFITGIGAQELDLPDPPDISSELNQHLRALYRAEQAAIYDSLLQAPGRGDSRRVRSLYSEVNRLTTFKALVRQQMTLFYPQLLLDSDELRSAITGQGGLLDSPVLNRFKGDNVPVEEINTLAFERLARAQREWRRQPELVRRTGSVAGSLAHAMMRLDALYRAYFASQPDTLASAPAESPEPGR